jgi:hypothetical protein
VEDQQLRVYKKECCSQVQRTSFGRKGKKAWEYGGFRIESLPKSCSIGIKAWIDELHERSRRWGRNQDFVKTPAGECIKVFCL